MKELRSHNYARANVIFQLLARGPSYVRYSALAQLRLADARYFQGQYQQAVLRYSAFINQHPTNPNVPYARFRMAASYVMRMPSTFFLLPPSYESDLTMTRHAARELQRFLKNFPISRYAEKARKMLNRVRTLLCHHELYVARFYKSQKKLRAVAWRLDSAIKKYPKCARTEKNVWLMAASYAKSGAPVDAARSYAMYVELFPKGSHRKEAMARLEVIRKTKTKTKTKKSKASD
jgi:outer membrane protein assembly factor BamD